MNAKSVEGVSLRHVIVVGGSLADWAATPADQWPVKLAEWGKVADHVGARWLTVRPFAAGETAAAPLPAEGWQATVGSCLVSAVPDADGRARFTRVVAGLHADGVTISEASISAALNAPADADPDLVVVIGADHRMPPSLVWELAYSELVYVDTTWQHFGAGHLDDAIGSYAHRHRRFGGID